MISARAKRRKILSLVFILKCIWRKLVKISDCRVSSFLKALPGCQVSRHNVNNIPVIFDHGLFCSKRNNKKVHFCLTYTSGFEMYLLKYHCSKPYLLMYLAFKCEYIMNL